MLGYRQAVRQRILIPSCEGSNPSTLANFFTAFLKFREAVSSSERQVLWRHSQVVRQRSAKPLFPSSNLGVASMKNPERFAFWVFVCSKIRAILKRGKKRLSLVAPGGFMPGVFFMF